MSQTAANNDPAGDQLRRGWWGFRPADDTWELNLAEVVQFRSLHGHWPRASRTVEPEERRLGRWLSNQRQDSRNLLLSELRQQRLDQTLPGWMSSRGIVVQAGPPVVEPAG